MIKSIYENIELNNGEYISKKSIRLKKEENRIDKIETKLKGENLEKRDKRVIQFLKLPMKMYSNTTNKYYDNLYDMLEDFEIGDIYSRKIKAIPKIRNYIVNNGKYIQNSKGNRYSFEVVEINQTVYEGLEIEKSLKNKLLK